MGTLSKEELAKRAMTSTAAPRRGFGIVKYINIRPVVWDAPSHKWVEDDGSSSLEIEIGIETLKKDGGVWMAKQKYIETGAKTSKWRDVTRFSLEKLHVGVSEIEGKPVEYLFKPTGEKYEKKVNDQPSGQFVDEETFWFVKIFQTENDMVEAWMNASGGVQGEKVQPADNGSSSSGPNSAIVGAAKTLFGMYDLEEFKNQIQKNPVIWREFKEDMAAVLVAVGAEAGEDVPF